MKKKKVGIIGYGIVGKRRRQYIDAHPDLETVCVSDVMFDETHSVVDGVKACSDHTELLESDIDAILVSVPNHVAADITIAGIEKGIHVFCEKPPGRTVEDIERVIAAEKAHSEIVLKYGFNHRYHGSVQEALRIIGSGELGEVINMEGTYGKGRFADPKSNAWRSERKYAGGGILLDQGIHMLDLMRLFCGEFTEVKSFISNDYWKHDVEENAFALMKDERGRVASIHSSATLWEHSFSLHIYLTEGYLKLSGILSGSKSYGEEVLVIGRRADTDHGTLESQKIKYLQDNSWKLEIDEFADAIMGRTPVSFGTSTDALKTMQLVYRIYYADKVWREKFDIQDPDK